MDNYNIILNHLLIIKTKFLLPQAYVTLVEFCYPNYVFWFYCSQRFYNYLDFQIFLFLAFLIKVILDTTVLFNQHHESFLRHTCITVLILWSVCCSFCPITCLYVFSSVFWCTLRFQHFSFRFYSHMFFFNKVHAYSLRYQMM
jgi:hypothetical protein